MSDCPEPGIYPGVPFDEYFAWESVNNSILSIIDNQSPMHAKEYAENPPPKTAAFIFGGALHTRVLEPDKFPLRYVVAPKCDRRTKSGKEQWAAFETTAGDREIITLEDYEVIQAIASAIQQHVAHKYIQNGEAEVCIVWDDPATGLRCKARLDYVHRSYAVLIDLKTTKDASAKAFAKSLWYYHYYQQCAWYCDGWKALTQDTPSFVLLAAEKGRPYAVAAYEMDDAVIRAGRNAYKKALEKYAECAKSGEWPGYENTVEMMTLPQWALTEAGVGPHEIEAA